jgi:hypothetical protein
VDPSPAVSAQRPPYQEKKHSGCGIASFTVALTAGEGLVILVHAGGYRVDSPLALAVVQPFMGGLGLLLLVGIVLGIAGAADRERKHVFATIGLWLNAALFVGWITAGVLGGAS